jgi:Pyruvate/2-oxoacid:ferredoxin oxidoreductase delta subunit/flavodoxin
MSNAIYYFSATGNSLAFARNLAAGLGETELVSMPRSMEGLTPPKAERVGLIFPVYVWGLPRIVVDFLNEFKVSDSQYVFAVATCGGVPANTLMQARDLLRRHGGHLDAGFAVREPSYFTGGENGAIRLVNRAAGGVRPELGADRLAEIIEGVRGKRRLGLETSPWAANVLGSFFHSMSGGMMAKADKGYRVTESCASCGTCVRVCPRANIQLVGGKPRWSGNCQMCEACLQWCPQGAIRSSQEAAGQPRGHRDGVTLTDMLVR